MRFLRRLLVLPIRFYQRVVSPLMPPSCRFLPSCSEYGAESILTHGFLKGLLLGGWRILRCHPFNRGGFDPVPPPGRWKSAPVEGPRARDEAPPPTR